MQVLRPEMQSVRPTGEYGGLTCRFAARDVKTLYLEQLSLLHFGQQNLHVGQPVPPHRRRECVKERLRYCRGLNNYYY